MTPHPATYSGHRFPAELISLAMLNAWDAYADAEGHDLPEDSEARTTLPDPSCVTNPLLRLNVKNAGISTVVWATGYRGDFGWVDAPVFDAAGIPAHQRGVTAVPGLYFLTLPWLSCHSSIGLAGAGLTIDTTYLADRIAARA